MTTSNDRPRDAAEGQAADFVPAWWCRSGHAQTIWAGILRPTPMVSVQRERWEIPDGDFLDVDYVPATPGRPVLIVLHGLEGSSDTKPVRGFLLAAQQRRWHGIGVNFRSCSGTGNRLRRSYHGGDTADLNFVVERVVGRYPGSPICCVAMSLGGNVLLKYLGEQAEHLPSAVKAAVAISAPFNLATSAHAFEVGPLNRVYMRRLLRSLKEKTRAKLVLYPDVIEPRRLDALRTIAEFDEAITAPMHGFASAQSYWAASSCGPLLPLIHRPTLLINALDDPLVPADDLPRRDVAEHRFLSALFPQGGGHTGFVSGPGPLHPIFWAEQRAIAFCAWHILDGP